MAAKVIKDAVSGVVKKVTQSGKPMANSRPTRMRKVVDAVNKVLLTYFRVESEGWENIPDTPCLIVSIHSAGGLCYDALTLVASWEKHYGTTRLSYGGAHDMILRTPLFGEFYETFGSISPTRENINKVFSLGHDFCIFPGGDADAGRLWKDRDKAILDNRLGFIKMALMNGVPILPVSTIGGHDAVFIFSEGKWLAKAVNSIHPAIKKFVRLDKMPIAFTFPFGVVFPLAGTHIPFPTKIRHMFLKPIHLAKDKSKLNDESYLRSVYDEVVKAIEAGNAELAKKRKFPIWG